MTFVLTKTFATEDAKDDGKVSFQVGTERAGGRESERASERTRVTASSVFGFLSHSDREGARARGRVQVGER